MRTERLVLDTVVLIALSVVLGVIGWLAAPAIFEAAFRSSGVHELVMLHPTDVIAEYPGIALAVAMAAPLTWIVGLAYRGGSHRPPHPALLGGSLALLLASAILGMVWVVALLADVLQDESEIRPMITPGSFELGASGTGLACRVAIVSCIAAFALGRRAKDRDGSSRP